VTIHAMATAGVVAAILILGIAALAVTDQRICRWANETDEDLS